MPFEPVAPAIVNSCESDADCGRGAVCADLGGGKLCVSTSATLGEVLVEVQPALSQAFGADTPFLVREDGGNNVVLNGSDARGVVRTFDRRLPALFTIQGSVTLREGYNLCGEEGKCCPLGDDRSVPASVTFRRVRPYSGLRDVATTADTQPTADGSHVYQLSVVQGEAHSVYVVPKVPEGCKAEPPPPQLLAFPAQSVPVPGVVAVLDRPHSLDVRLDLGGAIELADYVLEVLDPRTGRRTSNAVELGDFEKTGKLDVKLRYYRGDKQSSPVVRLGHPDALGKPALYWELDTLDFDGDGKAEISLAALAEQAKDIEARVAEPGEVGAGVAGAAVILQSVIDKDSPTPNNYAFRITTQTDEEGFFAARLPPGKYKVVVEPRAESGFAIAVEEWEVTEGALCCGRRVELRRQPQLEGSVERPNGAPYANASVLASSALLGSTGLLSTVLTYEPTLADGTAIAGENGDFALSIDPGRYDLSVRPEPASRFPWLVRHAIEVPAEGRDLGNNTITHPAVLTGRLVDPDGKPLVGAAVRAFVPFAFPPDRTRVAQGAAVAVGEAQTGDDGRYMLVLPSGAVAQE